jgi:hypothetical protein
VVLINKPMHRSAIGQVNYNSSTGIIHRGYNDVLLSTQREKLVFEHLFSVAAAEDETFVSRTELMELGGKCSEQTIRRVMYRLSDRLAPVKCCIMSSFGKNGGYRLVVEP